jgi:hypothetical protein
MGQSEQLSEVGRNSSRVLAAPGGHSEMGSLLGGYAPPAPQPPRQQQQQVAVQPQQQQMAAGQRVELRTEHTGITVGNVSSRVLAVPGGASDMASIISGTPAADCSATDRIAALKAKRMQLGDATNDTRGPYSTRPF